MKQRGSATWPRSYNKLGEITDLPKSNQVYTVLRGDSWSKPGMQDSMFLSKQLALGKWGNLQKFLLSSWDQTLHQWFGNAYTLEITPKQNHSLRPSAAKTSPGLAILRLIFYLWGGICSPKFVGICWHLLPAKIICRLIIYSQNNPSYLCFRYIFPRRLYIFNGSPANKTVRFVT